MSKKRKGASLEISGYLLVVISIFNYALGDIEKAKVLILSMGLVGILLVIVGKFLSLKK